MNMSILGKRTRNRANIEGAEGIDFENIDRTIKYNSSTGKFEVNQNGVWTPIAYSSDVPTDYVTATLPQTITGAKNFIGGLGVNSTPYDSNLVHLTSTETITGSKNFTGGMNVNGTAYDSNLVHLNGAETITGTKNFTGGLNVNGVAYDSNLVHLDGTETLTGKKGFNTTGTINSLVTIGGGNDSNGLNGEDQLEFQFHSGGYSHFISSCHNASDNHGNALRFWINKGALPNSSSSFGNGANSLGLSVYSDGAETKTLTVDDIVVNNSISGNGNTSCYVDHSPMKVASGTIHYSTPVGAGSTRALYFSKGMTIDPTLYDSSNPVKVKITLPGMTTISAIQLSCGYQEDGGIFLMRVEEQHNYDVGTSTDPWFIVNPYNSYDGTYITDFGDGTLAHEFAVTVFGY